MSTMEAINISEFQHKVLMNHRDKFTVSEIARAADRSTTLVQRVIGGNSQNAEVLKAIKAKLTLVYKVLPIDAEYLFTKTIGA